MEEKEKKNYRGLFLSVVGVITLVVAIVGATFAYFSASATNSNVIVGNTSDASNLELNIRQIAGNGGSLIPMFEEDESKGIQGTNGTSCVDANGNTVCHIYEIALTNGNSPVDITGGFFITTDASNIVADILVRDSDTPMGINDLYPLANGAMYYSSPEESAEWEIGDEFTLHTKYTANQTKYYYFVVWLRDTGSAQEDVDANKSYVGHVKFEAITGFGKRGGVTAMFGNYER